MDTTTTPTGTASGPGDAPHTYGTPPREDRLVRAGDRRMLAGVAAGIADYFDIDPTIVRAGFVVLTLMGGLAVPLYVAGWVLMPAEGADVSIAEEMLHRERAR
ncbi:MAG TPA: PspC domain-containing protein [Acidimicrobiales bacterium]|nr:PspC domain-containing protein [Acidimicrobiales bacterium]